MDSFKVALEKALEKFDQLRRNGELPSVEMTSIDSLVTRLGTEKWLFPYFNLRAGDVCLVEDHDGDSLLQMWNGKQFVTYVKNVSNPVAVSSKYKLLKKIGYNVLEDEDLNKKGEQNGRM